MVAAAAVTVRNIGGAKTGGGSSGIYEYLYIFLAGWGAGNTARARLWSLANTLVSGACALALPAVAALLVCASALFVYHEVLAAGVRSGGGSWDALCCALGGAVVGALVILGMMATNREYGRMVTEGLSALGPYGWIPLGASGPRQDGGAPTWDCWKPVLRDSSPKPSETGILLKDVADDPRVRSVTVRGRVWAPEIVLENIWGEQFQIRFVLLRDGPVRLAAHATRDFRHGF